MRRTCLDMVHELSRTDERVVFVGSDLGPGTLAEMQDESPERFYMEGVAEQNLIGMAAGMALDGFVPYVNTIATFITRRCFEQVALDLCLHDLPVRLIANGGGLVYAPLGPTHMAIDDIALMRTLPAMTVVCPADADEMRRFMRQSVDWPHPIYIRLGKGGDPIVSREADGFTIGKSILLREPGRVLIVATGVMVHRAMLAAEILSGQGIGAGVLNCHTVKPLDEDAILRLSREVELVVTLDEHLLAGGLGSAVAEMFLARQNGRIPRIHRIGIDDQFPHDYGSQDSLMKAFGLQPEEIAGTIKTCCD